MLKRIKILSYPDPKLRKPGKPVHAVDAEIRKLSGQMLDLMYDAKGVGLAATQIGVPLRVFVMDLGEKGAGPEVLVNPVVIEKRGEEVTEEGCLSFPDIYGRIVRAAEILIAGRDLEGREVRVAAVGFRARAIQHELDHLDGVLIVDRMDEEVRRTIREQVSALERAYRKLRAKT